jgi:antitoxin VapB
MMMSYARVFKSGNSQAVRLPKEFRFDAERVEIFRRGDEVILRDKPANAAAIFDALASLPQDMFTEKRNDNPPQQREPL